MGFSSQAGSVGFALQTAKGAFVAVTAPATASSAGAFMRIKSGSLGGSRDLMITDSEVGGNRDVPDAYLGPVKFEGEYEAYARMDSLGILLYGALGSKSSAASASAGLHTITPVDVGGIPWISVEENISDYENFRYTDAKVNTLHLEADATGYLMCKVGLIALSQASDTTPTASATAPWDNSNLMVGSNITISFAGTNLPAKSFSFDVNNNLEDDDFRLGSLFLGDLTEKRREVTMGCTIRPADSSLWKQAMYGSSVVSVAGGTKTTGAVVITCDTYEVIPTLGANMTYRLKITVPSAVIKPFGVTPSGDDALQHDLEIQALRPSPGTALLTCLLRNGKTLIA